MQQPSSHIFPLPHQYTTLDYIHPRKQEATTSPHKKKPDEIDRYKKRRGMRIDNIAKKDDNTEKE
jgi:hypothetical protein